MLKKKFLPFMLACIMASTVVLSGCGSQEKGNSSKAEQKLELKSADVIPANSPYTIAMNEKFVPLLKEKTNGRINVTHYAAGQLGNDTGIVEGIKLGTIDFGVVGTIPSKVTEALYLPWLFKDAAHMNRVLNGEIGEQMKESFYKETGIRMLGFAYQSQRIMTANKPVKSLDDLKGMKVRVPQMAPMIATWKAMGVNPTPIAFTELFTALQSGTVDAQENSMEVTLNGSLYEVQKYMMETNHGIGVRFLIVNDQLWQSLSDTDKKAVMEAWKETSQEIEKLYIQNDAKYKQDLLAKGITLVPIDTAPMQEAVKNVWKDFAPQAWGEGVYEKIQELRDK
jgi:tripartite ATP-independent transporter DctP family solute receptor